MKNLIAFALVAIAGVAYAGEKTQAPAPVAAKPVVKAEPKTVLVPTTVLKKETVLVPKTVVKKETVLVPVKVAECSDCETCVAGVGSRVRGRVFGLRNRVRGVVGGADCACCN